MHQDKEGFLPFEGLKDDGQHWTSDAVIRIFSPTVITRTLRAAVKDTSVALILPVTPLRRL